MLTNRTILPSYTRADRFFVVVRRASRSGRVHCAHILYVTVYLTETGYTLAVVSRQTGDEAVSG
jgi:hypothetical protein